MWGTLRIKNIEKGSGIYIHYYRFEKVLRIKIKIQSYLEDVLTFP